MKRALHFVLLTLLSLLAIEVSAAAKKQSKPKKAQQSVVRVYKAEAGPAIAVSPRPKHDKKRMGIKTLSDGELVAAPGPGSAGPPTEGSMRRAGSPQLDLRFLPQTLLIREERPEREAPVVKPVTVQGKVVLPPDRNIAAPAPQSAPAPSPSANFLGLDFASWGAGHPPDTVGDVGPNHYIQAVNTSVGIYSKSGGAPLAAFNFNALMSQAHFGNLCDTNNFGDPVILYDTFEDRWVITDFAFQLSGGNVVNPPGSYQCFAVSKTGDPISGGWNFYSLHLTDQLQDYPKLGIWPDGIYMSANMFGFPATGSYGGTRVWALNKAQMYAGASTIQVVQFNPPADEFTLLPSNARLQAGTPPAGAPNYFSTVGNFTNAVSTYKFHVDWSRISLSTFDGPFVTIAPTSWNAAPDTVPAKGGNNNDALATRPMMQNQYTNLGGVESLWLTHTVANPTLASAAAVRYYQTNVTGGSVAANTTQALTHAPDAINRYIPSLAVDRAGNMALGYSASTSTLFPAIRYAGRLASDPLNALPETETSLIEGTGSQTSSNRWGDYSAMSLDPDGCTFWFTNEYYAALGGNWQTRIGSFNYGPSACMPVATGSVSGTVIATAGGAPIAGATVSFGSRTAATNGSGVYSFLLVPSGSYPGITVTVPGYNSGTASTIAVTDGNTTTQNFSLSAAPASGCFVDTSQADFQTGIATNTDLTSAPGAVILLNPLVLDQQNTSLSTNGNGVDTVNWGGQTFTAGLTGPLARVAVSVFCYQCTGTFPNLTLSLRATSGNLPAGPDLATTTLPGNNSGASGYITGTFATPATVTAGTTYALIVRPVANPSAGTYALTFSSGDAYANGRIVSSSDSGGTWSGASTDLGFRTYVKTFTTSGDFLSSVKDANPAPGATPIWSTISWTATVPANTSLTFQVAASNSATGPFNFVGPGGTAATYFTTSGASLSQFYGFRYLKYKAYLATTDTTQTPVLNDVTICYSVADCSAPITITTPSQVCANSTGNTASGPAGAASYAWSMTNGTIVGSAASQSVTYTAGASGSVGLTLNIVDASGCHKSASANVSIPATPTPTVTPSGPTTFCSGGSVTLTSSSASGNQWYNGATLLAGQTNQTYVATTTGNYNVVMSASGCSSAASASTAVTVNAIPATPTVTPGGPTTFCGGGSVTLTSSSSTGNQWYNGATLLGGQTNQTYVATATGNYNVVVTASGCSSAPSASTAVTVTPLPPTPTVTPSGATTFCTGGSVTLTSSSASGNQWYDGATLLAGQTNASYVATATGNYNVVVMASGCSSAPSSPRAVTVNAIPSTPTITPGGPTTFCAGGSVTLTSSSASGNQWYNGATLLAGQTNQTFLAAASGNYNVVVTASGCSSAPSSPTAVTVTPLPPTPTVTPSGATTFCTGGSVTLTSSSASGNQWYNGATLLAGQTNQTYAATTTGNYNVVVTAGGCSSAPSASTAVTVNAIPPTPAITPGGPTTFCAGGSVTLTSSSVSGNQWYNGATLLAGQTGQTFAATATGNYSVSVTASGCPSAASSPTTVTVNPLPPTPTITPGGATTFCNGGSVTLTSSSTSGNQWFLNGNPIGGASSQVYIATASGNYSVKVIDGNSCTSAASAFIAVTVNATPATPTITPGGSVQFCSAGSKTLTSSSAAGNQWYLEGVAINGATNQTVSAGNTGHYSVIVTANGCASASSAATNVTINPTPAKPVITAGGPATFCAGGSVTLNSNSASGNQWYLNGNPIIGATNQSLLATASGSYTATVTTLGCVSSASDPSVVTVNPLPATPAITPGGPTTFCAGGSVVLTSSSATGNQWSLDGNAIGGATNQLYSATSSGSYTVKVTGANACTSASSAAAAVTVNPIPAPPSITPGGPTAFCAGGSVNLISSSATGNQWFFNGNAIGGATNQAYAATASGSYTVIVTTTGCSSVASAATTIAVNPKPNAAITAPIGVIANSTGNTASIANAGAGATYAWSITGGAITAGSGTSSVTFTAGGAGTLTLNVTVTTSAGCSDAKPANVTVALPPVTLTTVAPGLGTTAGGSPITINGSGFVAGASVTVGGAAATNVVVVSAIKITAKTPGHASGTVNVTVTNADTSAAMLTSGFRYQAIVFDPNGDNVIDPADIFFLINYLFTGGQAPHGEAGLLSGDANSDAVIDPADIFFIINYLFLGGQKPSAVANTPRAMAVGTELPQISGSISLGQPVLRGGHYFVPVILTAGPGSIVPRTMSLKIHFDSEGTVGEAAVRRAGAAKDLNTVFEFSRRTGDDLSYLVSYDPRGLALGATRSAMVAEVEIASVDAAVSVSIDPLLTMLGDQSGATKATVANGKLEVSGTTIGSGKPPRPRSQRQELN